MKDTKLVKLTGTSADKNVLEEAGRLIRQGELVIFPTETVYGIGANGLDTVACRAIYTAKGRPSDNPLILTVPDKAGVEAVVSYLPPLAETLIEKFWPGPLTLVLPRKDTVPDAATGGLDTVALRCPDHAGCREFLKAAGVPVAGPSANLSGRPSPTTAAEAFHDMEGRVAMILDGGSCTVGVESTIVEVLDNVVTVLRPGAVTEEMLAEVAPYVTTDTHLVTGKGVPKAPGMKYRHYAPEAPVRVFVGSADQVSKAVGEVRTAAENDGKHLGYLLSREVIEKSEVTGKDVYCWGTHGNKTELAKELYRGLLFFDEHPVDLIVAEGVETGGIGTAVMNRMKKAADGDVTTV